MTAKVAILADHYGLTMPEVGNLTDRQIKDVYFHARTKEGAIEIPLPAAEPPAEEETEEIVLRNLQILRGAGLIPEENYLACVEEAKRKFRAVGP